MKKGLNKGSGVFAGIATLAVILVIIAIMPKETAQIGFDGQGSFLSSTGSNTPKYEGSSSKSPQNISIGSGNASYAYQPYEEYVTIENRGNSAVDLTGWTMKNGKDKRPYYSGNVLQRFSADIAVLPKLVLMPGERAVVTTGSVGVQTPYKIKDFKENICTGYIEALSDYAFTPPLTLSCPRPALEPGLEGLDRECREFVEYLPTCRTPQFENKDRNGEDCTTCINGKRLSSVCAAFIKEHFSYQGCLAYHGSDPKFELNTWRIFLGRGWEMWADKYETIELFNTLGQLVDSQNY